MSYKTRVIVVSLMLIGISVFISACSTETRTTNPSSAAGTVINQIIDVKAAYNMIQSNQGNPDFVIIDVRTKEEFDSGHIAGAVMIDFYQPDFKNRISELDRNKKYLVYCRTANRSGQAVEIMQDLGFREVYDMAGGITQWAASGHPTVKN